MWRNEKEDERRITQLMKTHLNGKYLFLPLNISALSVIKYNAAFLNWTKEKTKELDHWTRTVNC